MTQESPTEENPAETEVRKALKSKYGINRLLKLLGTKSINRNMQSEDRAFRRYCTGKRDGAEPRDDMEIYAGGDVHITQPSGDQSASAAPEPKAGAGWLPTLLVGASILAGGAGLGYIIHDLLKGDSKPPEYTDTDTDTITELDFPT